MKKTFNILLVVTLLIPCFFTCPIKVDGKTLGQLKNELQNYIEKYEENQQQVELTEQEIKNTKNRISEIKTEVAQIGKDMLSLSEEIEKLNQDIILKEQEIKDIMNFVQISNGESAYLEYAFGAKDFTDFIYRAAIAEQLSQYNDKLIEQFNNNIEQNKIKTEELKNKKEELNNKQNELSGYVIKLGNKMEELEEDSISIEEEIKSRKEAIDMYENQYGCKDYEDVDTCAADILPPDTSFYRPLVEGYVTSNFDYYNPFGTGSTFHYALDLSTSDNNTPVYSAANGVVAAVMYNSSCGKNIVYIQHIVNGERYTTGYWHLRRVFVQTGDKVTKDTQIGIMGGALSDNDCSTGAHVHFVVATGLYMIDYVSHSVLNSRRIDPRLVMNAPAKGRYFANRYTKY